MDRSLWSEKKKGVYVLCFFPASNYDVFQKRTFFTRDALKMCTFPYDVLVFCEVSSVLRGNVWCLNILGGRGAYLCFVFCFMF